MNLAPRGTKSVGQGNQLKPIQRSRNWRCLAPWLSLAVCAGLWIYFVYIYGADWPVWDDWAFVPFIVKHTDTWSWIWNPHGEHRMALAKLVYVGLLRLTGFRFTAIMYLNVAVLTLASVAIIAAVKRSRGRIGWIECAIPPTILTLSQFENIFWGFQVVFTMATALALLAMAGLIAAKNARDWRPLFVSALSAGLLPLCGGMGMGFGPPITLWLFILGVAGFRSTEKRDRACGVVLASLAAIAAGVWVCSIRGLPETPGMAAFKTVLHTHENIGAYVKMVCGASFAFLANFFLPQAGNPAESWFYRYGFWSVSAAVILGLIPATLLVAWRLHVVERFRILSLGVCFLAFALVTVLIGIGRGVFGPLGMTQSRYASIVIPGMVLAIITSIYFGMKGWRWVIPLAVVLLLASATFAPRGSLHRLREDGNGRITSYQRFGADLAAGKTVEFLAAKHSMAIFGPHDSSYVPAYIAIMAEEKMGPFRKYRGALTHEAGPFETTLVEPKVILSHSGVYDAGSRTFRCAGPNPYFIIALGSPRNVTALRLTFRGFNPSRSGMTMRLWWYEQARHGGISGTERSVGWNINGDQVQIRTAYVYDTIDHLRFDPDIADCTLELEKIELLSLPTSTTAPLSRPEGISDPHGTAPAGNEGDRP